MRLSQQARKRTPVHELSLCNGLLRQVEQVADAHHAVEVTGIVLAVGPLSGAEPSLLSRAFHLARIGTIAENAELEIEHAPAIVRCDTCGVETEAAANALSCGRCGTWKVTLKAGNELMLKRVDLVPAEQPIVAAAS